MITTVNSKTHRAYYLAWFTIAAFYLYQYILRVSPGIMIVELRQLFKLTAEEISSLGAIYLYAYSLVQIPLGFILDRVGVRRVLVVALGLCLFGSALFTYASSVRMLQWGRFWIGLGSAPAFICALKFTSDYLPARYHGLFMGATLSLGTLGALLSGKFIVLSLDHMGWESTLLFCLGLGVMILLPILVFVPAAYTHQTFTGKAFITHLVEGVRSIFHRKEILIYSILAISVYTPLCVLADLWGTMFLMEKFSLARADAAQLNLYMYGGLTVGSLVLPSLSLMWRLLKEMILLCGLGIIVAIFLILYAPSLSTGELTFLLASIGFFCGAEMICFAGAAQASHSSYSGLTLGVVNTLNMLGGAFLQQIVGWYLDLHWTGTYGQEGARYYGQAELTSAFLILVFAMIGCTLTVFFLPKRIPSGYKMAS
jgi:MFS family permease